nr:hypothetical protein [Actinomycetota bacterium]
MARRYRHTLVALCCVACLFAPMAVQAQSSAATCFGKSATIVGTDSNDVLTGTGDNDVIVGHLGFDTITGGAGNDFICGSRGDDVLYGEEGADRIDAGPDKDDVLYGGAGSDFLDGGAGISDVIVFATPTGVRANLDTGTATGEGNDSIVGAEELAGSPGNDFLTGNSA